MSDGQSITLKIAGKEYSLKAASPELEQIMRIASETINQKLSAYDAKFPDKMLVDKLAFVTLNETIGRISAQRKYSDLETRINAMLGETSSYLEKVSEE